MFLISDKEKEQIESFPIAISLAQIIDEKLEYFLVSDGFCNLFRIDRETAILGLNNKEYSKLDKFDQVWVREVESNFIKGHLDKYNITCRTKLYDNKEYLIVNINAEKKIIDGKVFVYFSYSDISNSYVQETKVYKIFQEQRTKIAEESPNAIIVIAKKDYRILYLNQVAKTMFKDSSTLADNFKCYNLVKNADKPCDYCPIVSNKNSDSFFFQKFVELDKEFKIHFAETVWDNEEAYIEYLIDETEQKRNQRLFNLYKDLIEHRKNTDSEIGALYCFDLVTQKIVFYFTNASKYNFDGKTFDEVVTYYYPNIVGDEDRKKFKDYFKFEKIKAHYFDQKSSQVEYHQKVGDSIIYMRANYNFLVDPISKNPLVVINVLNVTDRIEMEKMLKAIVSYQNEFVMRQDKTTETCIVYSRGNTFLGFPKGYSRYTYKELEHYIHDKAEILGTSGEKRLKTCREREALIKDKLYSVVYKIKVDNDIYYKRSLAFRDDDGDLFTVVYDVTDMSKEAEKRNEKLRLVNNKLFVAQRETSIANKAKSEFLSRMSHDMRTPLGAVISLSDFGISECEDNIFIEYFQQIKENGNYLLSLVNDILDYQQIEGNRIILEEKISRAGDTADAVKRIVILRAKEKSISLIINRKNVNTDKFVIIDSKRMKQVLVNLLNNAIKYTNPGGRVEWSINFEEKNNELFVIHTISDNGVGMSKEFQKRMFEPFAKEANELSALEGGSGLGLVIVKRIVDAMNGSIKCESEIGKGTTFIIKIPKKEPTDKQVKDYLKSLENVAPIYDFTSLKVLVCEDIKINQIIIKKILESKGIVVTIASNGLEGLNLVKTHHYDVVLMDISMPKMSGIDVTKNIRKFNKTLPIIALSANAFSNDIDRYLKAGMNAYLSKPINQEELFITISKLLENN